MPRAAKRYRWTLPPHILEKAVRELNEPADDLKRLVAIDKFREALKKDNYNLKLLIEDDVFLLKFLRARRFDQNEALKLLKNYHIHRKQRPEMFEKLKNPKMIEKTLSAGVVCPLQGRSKNGSVVFVTRFGKDRTTLQDCLAACCLTFERLLENEENQINGFVAIHDFSFLDTDVNLCIKPAQAARAMFFLQNGLPNRITKVFFLHQPTAFAAFFEIFQPLMKPSLREKNIMAGNEYKRIHDAVDKSVLPSIFMGTGQELDIEKWKQEVLYGTPS